MQTRARTERRRGMGWAWIAVVALVGVAALPACSSGGSNLSAACYGARKHIVGYGNATADRANSISNAAGHWSGIYNRATAGQLSESDLAAALVDYNTDLKAADAANATASTELAAFQKALAACDQKTLPKGCAAEFAQYQPKIDHENREATAYKALLDAIANQQNAVKTGDRETMNAATDAFNVAQDQISAMTTEHNQLGEAFNAAQEQCNKA